jgi:hypothetical protein
MKNKRKADKRDVDARTFQHQLGKLANTMALKVEREGVYLASGMHCLGFPK